MENHVPVLFRCCKCAALYPEKNTVCIRCGAWHSCFLEPVRAADGLWRNEQDSMTAAQLVKQGTRHFVSSSYPALKIGPKATVGIHGLPGAGKSTLLAKWLDGTARPLLFSQEEGLGDSLIQRFKRLEICGDHFTVQYAGSVEEIERAVERVQPSSIGFDSLSVMTLGIGDMVRLAEWAQVPVLFTLQVCKDGTPAGSGAVLHGADVIVEVSSMRWRISKNRFGANLSGEV